MTIPGPTEAEKAEWDKILCDSGLSTSRGLTNLTYFDEQGLDWAANGMQVKGGKLPRYDIGSRVNHLRVCQRCSVRFTSKRATAKYCGKKCRQRKPMLDERTCLVCGTPMQPKHRDARFHLECRYRGYRALQKLDSCASII